MLLCYLYRIQADDIDCVILATTSVLYYKYLTRMEKETGSEDENILPRSVNVSAIFSYLCSILFETTLYLLTITINTISIGTIVILSK